jgi:hypothetical protein
MSEVRIHLNLGEIEMAFAARRNRRLVAAPRRLGGRGAGGAFVPRLPMLNFAAADEKAVPSVRDFTVSPARRLADAVAAAAIVRDVAAFGALVLFGTMLAVVLSSADLLV